MPNRVGILMASATVNSKGQITIPVQVKAALGLQPGDEIEFIDLRNGQFAIVAATCSVKRLKGSIRKPKVIVSIDDMKAVFALKE
jgi:antitoxin PrlF